MPCMNSNEARCVIGNVCRAKKIHACVDKLRVHDRARAVMCDGCDRYIGCNSWTIANIGAVSLLDRPEQLAKVIRGLPSFLLTHSHLGTSMCTSFIVMFTNESVSMTMCYTLSCTLHQSLAPNPRTLRTVTATSALA